MKNAFQNTLTFDDAVRGQRPTAFSAMIKPVGAHCNLDCTYCYYLDKAGIYDNKQPVMNDELLETFIRQYIEGNDVPQVEFLWHGGEPLLAGLDFYRKAIVLQNKYKGEKTILNSLQTNGTLVNEEWCRFFKENNFLIGISIDGPQDIHDAFRINKGGEPTWEKVMRAIAMFQKFGIEYNTLSVINKNSEGRGTEVYAFLKAIGSQYMQFLPAVEYVVDDMKNRRPAIVPPNTEGSYRAPWSVSPAGFGEFLNDIFDEWVLRDVGNYYVQQFDAALAQWVGADPGICIFKECCGDAMVVEHNGDVYSCDHFVYKQHRLGNIVQTDLKTLYKSQAQFDFGIHKRNTLPRECLRCEYNFACRGECPKHRFVKTANGESGLNVLCEGYKLFFEHVSPYMDFMAKMLSEEKPPALVMQWARKNI